MQHISPSWHCGRNTRRGPSHRLTTNLLCLAALFLFALMPSTGWTQTRVEVTNAQTLRAALEDVNVTEIVVKNNIFLDNGHMTTNSNKPFNSLYLVRGTKTIKSSSGSIKTIYRGSTTPPTTSTDPYKNKYRSQSIVLTTNAHLTIENLILDGNGIENYASMVIVPPYYKTWTSLTNPNPTTYLANGGLTMVNCTIQNCRQAMITDEELSQYAATYMGNIFNSSDVYNYSAVQNTGGAGVHFQPGPTDNSSTDKINRIVLKSCLFHNNVIDGSPDNLNLIGGALAFSREYIKSGTIKGCTFTKNYAPRAGGAIAFSND